MIQKTIVITGAASGIGRATSHLLAKKGYAVCALDIDAPALNSLEDESSKYGFHLKGYPVDVTRSAELKKVRDEIASQHAIVGWINNAGIADVGPLFPDASAKVKRAMDINFMGLVEGTLLALETMEKQGKGTIVNMASVAGHMTRAHLVAYCASKHAVVGFTRSLQQELRLGNSPVKLALVSPGFVKTQILNQGKKYGFPEWLNWALAKPDEVAAEIVSTLEKGKEESFPTANGKMMLFLGRWTPKWAARTSEVLLADSPKKALINRFRL